MNDRTNEPNTAAELGAAVAGEELITEEEIPPLRRGRRRLCFLIQGLLLLILPLIPAVFLLYAVDRQVEPVYSLVAGTPVERLCLRILPHLWRQKGFFERQARNQMLSPQERERLIPILRKMAVIQPTHALKLKSGEALFGKLRAQDGEDNQYKLYYFDGERHHSRLLRQDEISFRRPIVYPAEELDYTDLRFLLSYPEANHFYLHPHLVVTDADFAKALQIHTLLSEMRTEFVRVFAPLLESEDPLHTHIVHFEDPRSFASALEEVGEAHLVNSASFFRKSQNCLFLEEPQTDPVHNVHLFRLPAAPDGKRSKPEIWAQLVRHEGAHQLATIYGLFRQYEQVPLWLEEGLAQYCEKTPFNRAHPHKLRLLREAAADNQLIPWGELLAIHSHQGISEDQLQLAYAQSWLLFRHLMRKSERARFFQYLYNWSVDEARMDPGAHRIQLLNQLETTLPRLEQELEQELTGHAELP